ncbi:serine hydrolase domain-containing protein [Amycolatopsis sp.]|jgi:CubicO group peptidase (beta-lactamase class C family)|uniref:serine hydrolase domain-containing protein n=1 Tax=Amycolatopsis sp. TaxID=37632 RepID=UPI002DF93FB1|nr:serine hydrolase domain-containing protein [Amycolatopsis sp.]
MNELLTQARHDRVFSAAAWSVGDASGPLDRGFLGTRSWDAPALEENDLWDLASVTKPIAGLVIMSLVQSGHLRPEDTLGALLPEYAASDKAAVTVFQLLTHTSGLPGGTPLYREHHTRDAWLTAMRTSPLPAAPGSRVEYSSQGFVLLGLIAEAVSGRGLDELVQDLVCEPAGMLDTHYNLSDADRLRAVSTEDCPWRGEVVTGEVHDENAVVLGGVAGHAGLFSTLPDMERLGMVLVAGGGKLLDTPAFELMTRCHTDGLALRRALAWQMVDPAGSPIGQALGPNAYGHTGFTGTSLWIDPDTARYYVLLTNRVHPSRTSPGIEAVRRSFHTTAASRPPV